MPNKLIDYGKDWAGQFKTAQDALQKLPPLDYLIEPAIYRPSLNIWYGLPGSYKTTLLIDAAISITTGTRWLEGQPGSKFAGFPTTHTPVLWIDADSGDRALHERFGAFLRVRKHKLQVPLYWASFLMPPFTATDDSAVTALVIECKRLKAGMIVIDNLGTISGGVDENSSGMIQVLYALRFISKMTGASVNVIHHQPKNANGRLTPRGHSSIEAAPDTAYAVSRDGDVVNVMTTKLRGATVEPFSAIFSYTHAPNTRDLQEARFWGIAGTPDATSAKAETTLLAFLKKNAPCNQLDLVTALRAIKIGRNRALTEIERLVRLTTIKEKPNQAHNSTLYSL